MTATSVMASDCTHTTIVQRCDLLLCIKVDYVCFLCTNFMK